LGHFLGQGLDVGQPQVEVGGGHDLDHQATDESGDHVLEGFGDLFCYITANLGQKLVTLVLHVTTR
jgi:hypothetical protein